MSTQTNVSTDLFGSARLGNLNLQNRIVMAPMTRSRAIGNVPNSTMADYYAQRAGAGLIVTEGTSPSPNGLGYSRIPGIFNQEQVEGWKLVTNAVHKKGGKIFVQLMHTGRASHVSNLPIGAEVLAPSPVVLSGQIWTDAEGMQPYTQPKEMSAEQIQTAISEYVRASKNAIAAGFDGVELHAANGYLLEQFLNPNSNRRNDSYGGSADNRNRFVIEIAKAVAAAIGSEKTGIRISPYGAFNEMGAFDGVEEQYESLAASLNEIGLVYVHMVDHSSQGAPEVPESVVLKIRKQFKNTLILSGGYDKAKAQSVLDDRKCELIAFGRPFIANPDFVDRLKYDAELSPADPTTFYTPGEKGYSDYPNLN
ncbi:alkene reductase [Leptospira gomenensis]|uniref:Alkene reductase n=1 Tax=Leptospira gomenensis TaxID=2484974 RepID=A0A5F1YN57_9LEPT|nr:alkene reductase [Leptospira gomenensis]TGK32748.1 alkene reductase [Leptospira gomenensis]TGK36896.1 alkene reductase [Leptospira gomenensis]TGK44367.1 alkene reductase [Leptospira gomenensis]TGK58860.1 alkene reductase [Leptospira gomenensis]